MIMSIIKPGHILIYECAIFDVCDVYGFLIQNVEDGLTFGSALVCDQSPVDEYTPETTMTCAEEALEAGRGPVIASQGMLTAGDDRFPDGDTTEDYTPPFLLARALYARLASGERVQLALPGSTAEIAVADEHALDSNARAAVTRFAAYSRDVLIARGDGVTLVVARDASWPVLVHLAYAGKCYQSFQRVFEG
jgi:hypothetical protein